MTVLCRHPLYFTGYNCLRKQTDFNPQTCYISPANPPESQKPTCQNGGNNFWYIHVGGKRTDWVQGTDAMCLSISSFPAPWGTRECQFSWTEEGCKQLLHWAGCIPWTSPTCFDCNSAWDVCDRRGVTDPSLVAKTRCPGTGACFTRRDKNGMVYRGCADGWDYLADVTTAMGPGDATCLNGGGYGSFVDRWCLCKGELCNGGAMPAA
ncbi:uncharacterized protein LOC106166948 [Lingula anatina]|uniref:Uncharacterized protein LOC106166948 n=1 Tax=Lingula anatina TaxID=7574 RepID=A0A1S3IT03_LINAN|nr:uncharacterized protein LOC106166948 [Lingula anatina]|eukprot:XP_013401066.1 uncharacterized protein LOC106166948 [Lingula anatina]